MNVVERILARGRDSAVAILHRNTVLTYGELRKRVIQLAGLLRDQGCPTGARVGLLSENSPFFVQAYLGVIRAGMVVVPLPTDLTAESLGRVIADAGVETLLVSNRLVNRVRRWVDPLRLTLLSEDEVRNPTRDPAPAPPPVTAVNDLAALMFTSGSTGSPKGVMITHRNIECNSLDIMAYMGLREDDRVMVVLPFHYCFGLSLLHTHLLAGGSLVLNNEFKLFPESMLAEMQREECTGFAGVPSTYQILLRNSRFRQMTFPSLRWFQQAGGRLPNACIQELVDSFPKVSYFLMYGQTEATARLSYLPPERIADKLGSIGHGLPSTKLEVLGHDGRPVAMGNGDVGEIVASGDNIALGYWNDSEETARYFRTGKLHTGDLARVDADGFIFIVEREREMIKSGGNRVSAKEVEDVIAELPEVVEVAVVGTPHDLLGEAIQAFVVGRNDGQLTQRGVVAHCQSRLPAFKTPQQVVFVSALPHSSSGKVLKTKLKEFGTPSHASGPDPSAAPVARALNE